MRRMTRPSCLAEVEVVATYDLFNINRVKLESLIHRVFEPARLSIEIKDRFGKPVAPREWFLVPLFVIDEAIERIEDGTTTKYDPGTASLTLVPWCTMSSVSMGCGFGLVTSAEGGSRK